MGAERQDDRRRLERFSLATMIAPHCSLARAGWIPHRGLGFGRASSGIRTKEPPTSRSQGG